MNLWRPYYTYKLSFLMVKSLLNNDIYFLKLLSDYSFDTILCNLGIFYIKCRVGEGTNGYTHARKAPYQLSYIFAHYNYYHIYFWDRGLLCSPSWSQIKAISLASVSPALGSPAYFNFFLIKLLMGILERFIFKYFMDDFELLILLLPPNC